MVEIFRPGNKAPRSGVYKVTHAQQHAEPHYVTLLFADTFPDRRLTSGIANLRDAIQGSP